MSGADGRRQQVDAGLVDKFNGQIGVAQLGFILGHHHLVLDARHRAQFTFHRYIPGMAIVGHLLGLADIFIELVMGSVDHDVGVAHISADFAVVDLVAVINMKADWYRGLGCHGLEDSGEDSGTAEF